jgi:hypothetical protein
VLAFCRHRRLALLLTGALAGFASAASAQGRLEATYTVTLAGIPIGKGEWSIDITDTYFTAAGTGTTTGLVRVFTGGYGSSSGKGTLNGGHILTSNFSSSITSDKKTASVQFTVEAGNVKHLKLDPPVDDNPDRIPLSDENQHGVTDPMSASLLRMPGTGDVVSAEACQRTVPMFDGTMRYDLQFAYKRMEHVKADKGYAGPAVVCAVYFTPIAGFNPSRTAMRYLTKIRDMEVWLAPIAGTRVLVPFRGQGPTPICQVVFAADKFVSTSMPTRASVNGAKVQ